jgi:protein-S-isoprenylcysteine O-methyltransferase
MYAESVAWDVRSKSLHGDLALIAHVDALELAVGALVAHQAVDAVGAIDRQRIGDLIWVQIVLEYLTRGAGEEASRAARSKESKVVRCGVRNVVVSARKRWVSKPPRSLLVGAMLFGAFMWLESALRCGAEARSAQAGPSDRGTTQLLGAAYGAGLLGVPLLAIVRGQRAVPAWLGPGTMVLAIGLRSWAAVALGRFYTRTLRTSAEQQVVRSGPYRFVRHPGYLGTLLIWLGYGLSSGDYLTGGVCLGLMTLVYSRRIEAEEAMLQQQLGQAYRAYMAETPRLVPFKTSEAFGLKPLK